MSDERWLYPYVEVGLPSTSPDLPHHVIRRLLREHAIILASRIVTEIELSELDRGRLPLCLAAVDRESRGLGSQRVGNMLRAFLLFLRDESSYGAPGEDDLPPYLAVFEPMQASPGYLTSPALLVIQSILYSHAQWSRTHHHEAYSAWEAWKYLSLIRNPTPIEERDRAFVAAIVAHQTFLRAAWAVESEQGSLSKEVAAYDFKGKSLQGIRAEDIGRTLFPFLQLPGRPISRLLRRFHRGRSRQSPGGLRALPVRLLPHAFGRPHTEGDAPGAS